MRFSMLKLTYGTTFSLHKSFHQMCYSTSFPDIHNIKPMPLSLSDLVEALSQSTRPKLIGSIAQCGLPIRSPFQKAKRAIF
ncbi:hypothetical protein Leryth_022283 [Lithospermum erythrorhizon]|nr:hypothetical protein Leryth_022283 [Lithospermum erythrorhizon]